MIQRDGDSFDFIVNSKHEVNQQAKLTIDAIKNWQQRQHFQLDWILKIVLGEHVLQSGEVKMQHQRTELKTDISKSMPGIINLFPIFNYNLCKIQNIYK